MALEDIRKPYRHGTLDVGDLDPDPIRQFLAWLEDAVAADMLEPNAAALATADASGRTSVRMMLLKGVDPHGFRFFTNYQSRKATDLASNPQAALCFWWDRLERQVRVEGRVTKLSPEASLSYFSKRPRGSQLGAWASPQSQPIPNRATLEQRVAELERGHPEGNLPLPDFWGGYLLTPDRLEFWQGRESRIHDRFRYEKKERDRWNVERLAP